MKAVKKIQLPFWFVPLEMSLEMSEEKIEEAKLL